MPAFQWLIIPAPSFIESDTLKGFLLTHPSFLIVLIFHRSYQALHFQKHAASYFFFLSFLILSRSHPPHSLSLLFLSKVFQSWQNCNCKHIFCSAIIRGGRAGDLLGVLLRKHNIDLLAQSTVNKASVSHVCGAIIKCKKEQALHDL